MAVESYRLFSLLCFSFVIATAGPHTCMASIVLRLTEGSIDGLSSNGGFAISLRGFDSDGLPVVFSAFANNSVNHPQGYYPPGTVSPTFNAVGLDLLSFSLSRDGTDIALVTDAASIFGPMWAIEVNGPALTFPDSVTSQVISGPASYSLEFNLYTPGPGLHLEPDYVISSTGAAIVDLHAIAHLDDGPDYFEIIDVNYLLLPAANHGGELVIPEPSTLFVWAVLGLTCFGAICRRF